MEPLQGYRDLDIDMLIHDLANSGLISCKGDHISRVVTVAIRACLHLQIV